MRSSSPAVIALVCAGLLTACSGVHSSAPSSTAVGGVGLRSVPSKPQYGTGEPLSITITATNTSGQQCRLSKLPLGVVTILSLTRDGNTVAPTSGTARFYESFNAAVAANLVTAAAGEAVPMTLSSEVDPATGDGNALGTYSADGRDGATVLVWPVNVAGHYQLTVTYVRPPLPDLPADACSASAAPATADFVVTGT